MTEAVPVTPPVEPIVAPDTQPEKTGAAAKFTQEDVDRILADRLKRAEDAVSKRILKDLGVDSLETATSALKAHQEAEDAKKSAADKAEAKVAAVEKKLADALAQINTYAENEKIRTRNTAIQSALTTAKAHDVEDLLIIIENKYPTEIAAVMGEDGTVDKKAIEKLMTAVKAGHGKYFTPQSPGSPSNRNGASPNNEAALEVARRAQFDIARRMFR